MFVVLFYKKTVEWFCAYELYHKSVFVSINVGFKFNQVEDLYIIIAEACIQSAVDDIHLR